MKGRCDAFRDEPSLYEKEQSAEITTSKIISHMAGSFHFKERPSPQYFNILLEPGRASRVEQSYDRVTCEHELSINAPLILD